VIRERHPAAIQILVADQRREHVEHARRIAARQQLAQHIGPLEQIGVAPAGLRMNFETGVE